MQSAMSAVFSIQEPWIANPKRVSVSFVQLLRFEVALTSDDIMVASVNILRGHINNGSGISKEGNSLNVNKTLIAIDF